MLCGERDAAVHRDSSYQVTGTAASRLWPGVAGVSSVTWVKVQCIRVLLTWHGPGGELFCHPWTGIPEESR